MSKEKNKKSALWGILLALAAFLIIVFMPPMEGLSVAAQRSLAIFVSALILGSIIFRVDGNFPPTLF